MRIEQERVYTFGKKLGYSDKGSCIECIYNCRLAVRCRRESRVVCIGVKGSHGGKSANIQGIVTI